MKITKQGTPEGDRIWKGRCHRCQSEAEARQSELRGIVHDPKEGGSFAWVKCPVCGVGPYGGMIFYSPR